jgi:hypothetical protein
MSDENKTTALLLAALGVLLGWTLGQTVATVDDKPDCERYWQQMSVYLQTENEADIPTFIPECLS